MTLASLLSTCKEQFSAVIPSHIQWGRCVVLDLNDAFWKDAGQCSLQALIDKTKFVLYDNNAQLAIGRYAEDRQSLYQRSELFKSRSGLRSLHLGIDLTVLHPCPVYAPLPGVVHSLADNQFSGDYGPTILLQHELHGWCFYTLYGHLSRASLHGCYPGQVIEKGQHFADLGEPEENGGWPIHLHFQVIHQLQGWQGGYPGVVHSEQADWELINCPNPNWMLQIDM